VSPAERLTTSEVALAERYVRVLESVSRCAEQVERGDPRDRRAHAEWRRSRAWRRGYPPELLGPREHTGTGARQVLRAAWDVAGAAGLRLAAQGGAVA
jgi:hypothetical protein